MQQIINEETDKIERVHLESSFELYEAQEEAEIEVVLSHIFLANLKQQLIGRNNQEN